MTKLRELSTWERAEMVIRKARRSMTSSRGNHTVEDILHPERLRLKDRATIDGTTAYRAVRPDGAEVELWLQEVIDDLEYIRFEQPDDRSDAEKALRWWRELTVDPGLWQPIDADKWSLEAWTAHRFEKLMSTGLRRKQAISAICEEDGASFGTIEQRLNRAARKARK
jgi:hypothetical protein